jgi:hypothetical protein
LLSRMLAYSQKIFGLLDQLESLKDNRAKPEIPAHVFPKALLILWLARLPSLNALDQFRAQSSFRRFLRQAMPCGDQIANVSEVFDVPGLRSILGQMHHRLVRNKVLLAFRGHRLAVVDGHEINCSYDRCCHECQQRRIKVNGEKRLQYYHRAVVFMLAGPSFFFLMDFEILRPKEDEGTAALRLISRVMEQHPRSFDILLGDGLYPQARLFKLLRRHGKHALVVLKDERRDILKDARALFGPKPKLTYCRDSVRYQCWDVEDLESWDSYPEKVRLVRSIETTTIRKKKDKKWIKQEATTEWVWVTTIPSSEVPTGDIVLFGHERWRIENEGFNELSNQWHADHYFHHHPVSITAFWLSLFIAHAVFHCFMRNLQPAIRHGHTRIFWALCILAEFVCNDWHYSSA